MNLWQRIRTTFHRRVLVVARDLGPRDARAPAALPGVRVERLLPAHLPAYASLRGGAAAAAAALRLAEGQFAWVASWEGSLAYTRWAAAGRAHVPYLRRDLLLGEHEVYVHDVFCDPRHRRRGLAAHTALAANAELWDLGYRRLVGVVAVENEAGSGLGSALGWETTGQISCLRLGPLQLDLAPRGRVPGVARPGQMIRSQSRPS